MQDCAGYDCLKSYIDRAEAAYSWTDLGNTLEVPDLGGGGGGGGWTGFVLNMTSQTWMSPDLGQSRVSSQSDLYPPLAVSRSEWWHKMLVIVPHNLEVCDNNTDL